MTLIAEDVDPANGLPYVDQDLGGGRIERRYLTALPTPKSHIAKALPGWQDATGITPIPRSEWQNICFERRHTEVPMLDQNGHGACVGYAATGCSMILRARARMTFVLLSADFLYTLINHGVDAGANGGDAVEQMVRVGISPASLVQGRPIRPAGYSKEAMAAAAAFKLRVDGAIPLQSFDEVVTAVAYGWQILFDVQAGGRYNTDSEGTIGYCGRFTNHEQQAGEGLRILNGKMQVLGRNSWSEAWGQKGFGWFTESHFNASNSTFALRFVAPNPNDPRNPPVFV